MVLNSRSSTTQYHNTVRVYDNESHIEIHNIVVV